MAVDVQALTVNGGPGNRASSWQQRIQLAKNARRPFEPVWYQNQAFAAGKHWAQWNPLNRRLENSRQVKDLMKAGRLYTADLLTQYLSTAKANLLEGGSFLAELGFEQDAQSAEDMTKAANQALRWAWENEAQGDRHTDEVLDSLLTYGTCASRCRFDPTSGPVYVDQAVWVDGRPVLDPGQAREVMARAQLGEQVGRVEIRPIRGRISLKCFDPWGILVPPGIAREWEFPWIILQEAVPVDVLVAEFPQADGLQPQLLTSMDLAGSRDVNDYDLDDVAEDTGRLEAHVMRYTCYELPTREFPDGRVDVLAGAQYAQLTHTPELPYRSPDGSEPRTGIVFHHFTRVKQRFWARGLVEQGIGIQKSYNKRRTQVADITDRSGPWVAAVKGTIKQVPRGIPMEVLYFADGQRPPQPVQGTGPGPWMIQELEIIKQDLAEAMGIRDVSLGENPTGVTTYSQLVQLNENDRRKMLPVQQRLRTDFASVTSDLVYDIRRYWPPGKVIQILGDGGTVEAVEFAGSKVPEAYWCRPKQSGGPASTGAELAKVDQIASYAASVGAPLPLDWYRDSVDANKPLPLPEQPVDEHLQKARLENERFSQGLLEQVPAPYDDHVLHLPAHRAEQVRMELAGRLDVVQALEAHVQTHLAALQGMMLNQQQMVSAQAQAAQAQQMSGQLDQTMVAAAGPPPAGTV